MGLTARLLPSISVSAIVSHHKTTIIIPSLAPYDDNLSCSTNSLRMSLISRISSPLKGDSTSSPLSPIAHLRSSST